MRIGLVITCVGIAAWVGALIFNLSDYVHGRLVWIPMYLNFIVQPLVTQLATTLAEIPESLAQTIFVVGATLLARPLQIRVKPFVDRFFWLQD